jgi:guanylate kinase
MHQVIDSAHNTPSRNQEFIEKIRDEVQKFA